MILTVILISPTEVWFNTDKGQRDWSSDKSLNVLCCESCQKTCNISKIVYYDVVPPFWNVPIRLKIYIYLESKVNSNRVCEKWLLRKVHSIVILKKTF